MIKSMVFTLIILLSSELWASGRSDKVFGVGLGVQEPYPGGAGFNIMFNLTNWARIAAGAGYYSDQSGDSLEDIPIGFIALMVYVLSGGNTPVQDSIDFLKGSTSAPAKTLGSYSGGLELLIPGIKFSPVIGASYGAYDGTNQPYNIPDGFTTHTYYKAGMDYQSDSGVNVQFGAMFAETLPKPVQYRGYFRLGLFF